MNPCLYLALLKKRRPRKTKHIPKRSRLVTSKAKGIENQKQTQQLKTYPQKDLKKGQK